MKYFEILMSADGPDHTIMKIKHHLRSQKKMQKKLFSTYKKSWVKMS
jgi:hypothetical protein